MDLDERAETTRLVASGDVDELRLHLQRLASSGVTAPAMAA